MAISSDGNSFPSFSIGITCAALTCSCVVVVSTAMVVFEAAFLAFLPITEVPIIAAKATTPITPPAIIFLLLSISWMVSTLSFTFRKNSFFFLLIFFSLSKFYMLSFKYPANFANSSKVRASPLIFSDFPSNDKA